MRRLLPFLLVLLFIGLILCLPFLLSLDRFRVQLADSLSRQSNHKVVIGRMEGGLFPPAIKLYDVGMLNPAGNAPLLQVDQITAPISWQALLQGTLAPRSLKFIGWAAYVHRKQDGRWDWEEWLGPTARVSAQAGWPLKHIILDRGECHAIDSYGPGPEEFVIQVLLGEWKRDKAYISINGVFTSLPSPVSFLFQGSGHFLANVQWSGVLSLSDENRQWKITCKMLDGHTEADGQSDQWRLDTAYAFLRYYSRLPVPPPAASPAALLQDWKSHFDWQGSALSFTQTASVGGGRSEVSGTVQYQPPLSTARVDIALQGAKIQSLEETFWGAAPWEGTATGLAHFDLVLSSAPWSQVSGQGALELKDGRYFWPEVSGKSLSRAHTMRYLLKKFPGFLQSGLNYSKLALHWQARRGVFIFSDAFCNLGDIQLAMAGTYDAPRRGLDAYTLVQVRERNAELLKELPPAYIDKGQVPAQIRPMHGRIQGTPSEWHLRAVRASKIPAGTLSALSRTIHRK
jgi:hypothetical protein